MTLKAQQGTSLSSGGLTLYAFDSSDNAVGCVDLYNYDPVNLRAAVGIVVLEEYRRQGMGFQMLHELTAFCISNTRLHQLYADIAATNQGSLRLFEKAGYIQCGTMREWVLAGAHFVDTCRLQLILSNR